MKILFIGAGNMGSAIIGGICDKVVNKSDIYIYEVNQATKDAVVSLTSSPRKTIRSFKSLE